MRTEGQRESRRQEERLAKAIGGKRNAASGALDRKGDVRSDRWLIEAKWTGKQQVTIRASVLEKIIGEAIVNGRIPVLGLALNGRNYVVLDENDWLDLDRQIRGDDGPVA